MYQISEGLKASTSSSDIQNWVTNNTPVIVIGVIGAIVLIVIAIIFISKTDD